MKGGALWINIERDRVDHIDFSDEPLWDPTLTADVRAGKLATIGDARTWIRAFFDGTVRGEWEPLKKLAAENAAPRSDLVVRRFGQMWP